MPREREEGQIRSQREVVSGGSQLGAGSGSLPIHRHRERLVQAVRDHPFLIVTGETGSGKTTQLPQYLYQAGLGQHGIIGVTQPRRVAAISVALRVAEEMACPPGDGNKVHDGWLFASGDSSRPLPQPIQRHHPGRGPREEPQHRYSLWFAQVPVGLGASVARARGAPEDHCDVSDAGGREAHAIPGWLPRLSRVWQDVPCRGNILQPDWTKGQRGLGLGERGQSEIERACDLLFQKGESINYRYDVRDRSIEGLLILPLYGSMSTDQQRKVFLPAPLHIRKCVVATNIAATSLTIDGIRYVVDCGFVKQLNHNPRVGLDILEVVPISKSEAVQRAGRAGRTSAGKCYRIYSKLFWETCMPDHMVPEIQRTSLSFVILTLKCLGVNNVVGFPYLDSPEERHILEALKNLYQNDAIDRTGCVTKLGRLMVEFPLRPSLTRALIKAAAIGCEYLLLPVAAMLSVESVFIRPGKPEKQQEAELRHRELALEAGGSNDFVTLLNVFEKCRGSDSPASWCREHWIHWRAMKTAFNVETQLREILDKLKQKKDFPSETFNGSRSELLRRCLCAGYFCNVARRSVGKTFHTMDGHGSVVHIHPSSILFDQESQLDWIIFHDVMATSKIYVRTLCPVRYEWVKDLLPKLHEVDVYQLSSMAKNEMAVSTTQPREALNKTKKQAEQTLEAAQKKLEKRNDEKSISDARARYLQRKLDKSQQNWMGQ
ncbi:probable ATP-dependent RNA helicase DHX40 isoform X3 [Chiloscyllium plagiosum]|uniref:probable ATP-dependent RNA helicase DHX40 isoform X3 n=1 Tax=Chiloscyllium plagiosum TaxID=36176 RepID=UPI001CB80F78|nr:probable ATP-dependent RNA helicase DHX40 isoform X3 [Chiloscyllium plagiosum]